MFSLTSPWQAKGAISPCPERGKAGSSHRSIEAERVKSEGSRPVSCRPPSQSTASSWATLTFLQTDERYLGISAPHSQPRLHQSSHRQHDCRLPAAEAGTDGRSTISTMIQLSNGISLASHPLRRPCQEACLFPLHK